MMFPPIQIRFLNPENYPLSSEMGTFIFALTPHFLFSISHLVLVSETFPVLFSELIFNGPRKHLVASVLFRIPIVREILLLLGCIDASKSNAVAALRQGSSLVVLPGGIPEMILAEEGKELMYLAKRKGFVKLAIEENVKAIVPIICIGESKTYKVLSWWKQSRLWLAKTFRIGIPLGYGRFGSLIPYYTKLMIIIGNPIEIPKEYDSNKKLLLIDQLHQTFLQQTQQIFERFKIECPGYENIELDFI